MDDRHPLEAPQVAGYLPEELIGRGGMGEVYRALDVRLGRPVGLKVLAADVVEDERSRERLLRESRLAASLDHPNVVPIYESGEQDGRLFIAMRYVPGHDLKVVLQREGALPSERAVAIAEQLAAALDAAHRQGLVHRDVKPSNVLLDRQDGREHCYLADFGVTQSASERGPADGQFLGTVAYVSPEQIRGDPVSGQADQYGLTCPVLRMSHRNGAVRVTVRRQRSSRISRSPFHRRTSAGRASAGHRCGPRPRHGEGPGRPV